MATVILLMAVDLQLWDMARKVFIWRDCGAIWRDMARKSGLLARKYTVVESSTMSQPREESSRNVGHR